MVRHEPVYRGIVGIDIERYSRAEWTDPIRARLRERLHRLVDNALAHSAIDPALTRRSDVGDGLWLLVGAEISTARLLHPLLTQLVGGLVEDNRKAPAAERMRLRLVVHAGEVLPDAHGETGASFIHAARLLDAQATRLVLSTSVEAAAVLVVSDVVHEGVVRHGYAGIDPSAWQRIEIHVKETSAPAWVHLPGLAEQPVLPEQLLLMSLPADTLPAHAPLPAGSRMPLAPNPLFVGRTEELRRLAVALKAGGTVALGQVVASTGLGGLGKTQLAVEFVHRYGRFFAGGVYWLSFANADEIPLQVAACAGSGAAGLEADLAHLALEERVRRVMDAWQSATPRLLVFDNCEEEALLEVWRPTSGGCRVVVTSRRPDWSPTLGVTALPLDLLSRADSIEMLRRYQTDLAADDPLLDAIAAELGDLPLALHLAGSYLRTYRSEVGLDAYLAELRRAEVVQHASLLGAGLDDSVSPTRHVQGVAQTFGLCLGRLDREREVDRVAIALLGRMACMAPGEPVPRDLLNRTLEGVEPRLRADGLRRLGSVGLVEERDGWLRMHRLLVHFVRQERLDPSAQSSVVRVLIGCSHDAKDGHLTGWALAAVIPHLVDIAGTAGGGADDERLAAELCTAAGWVLHSAGDFRAARPWYERSLTIREQELGPEHHLTASSLNSLARLLWVQGELTTARLLYERALGIRERTLGPQHNLTASSLSNLAELLRTQGELVPARPLYERALAIRKRVMGPDHPLTASTLDGLAIVLQAQGELIAARTLFEQARDIRERVLGPDHPETAQSLNNLGALLRNQGELDAARSMYERALGIWERVLGPDHPDTTFSLYGLARVLHAQDELDAAKPLYEHALDIRKRVLGPDHPHTASIVNSLACLLQDQGDLTAARPLFERALAIRERVLGHDHPDTVATRRALEELAGAGDGATTGG